MIIVIGSEKGGVMKSTTSVHLGAKFVEQGVNCCIVDTDSTASSSLWYARRSKNKFEPMVPVLRCEEEPVNNVIMLSSRFDVVIVDIGARDYEIMSDLALIADLWIIPNKPSGFDLRSNGRLCKTFKEIEKRHKNGRIPACFLITMASPNSKNLMERRCRDQLEKSFPDIPVIKTSLRNREAFAEISMTGQTVWELRKSSGGVATAEFNEFFNEVVKISTQYQNQVKFGSMEVSSNDSLDVLVEKMPAAEEV